jgi:hypothetical protein
MADTGTPIAFGMTLALPTLSLVIVIVEGPFLHWGLPVPWSRAWLLSLWANAASTAVGLLLVLGMGEGSGHDGAILLGCWPVSTLIEFAVVWRMQRLPKTSVARALAVSASMNLATTVMLVAVAARITNLEDARTRDANQANHQRAELLYERDQCCRDAGAH